MPVLHDPRISDEDWDEYKAYFETYESETLKMLDEETNPERIRKKAMVKAISDVWTGIMENDPDEFARKVKTLEEDPMFSQMFQDMREGRWDLLSPCFEDRELMRNISKRLGGVPKDAKLKFDKERKRPLTLQDACKFGDIKSVEGYLSQTEATPHLRNVDALDHRGITCLGYAVAANRSTIAKLLVEAGADPCRVDDMGNTGLHYAAAYGRRDMSDYVFKLGVDPSLRNHEGMTALDCAVRNKQKATTELFQNISH